MGEVYRADDLTLGQPVALKFLPPQAQDEEVLNRFRGEVRVARKVSHPNVCRVYDIGEADGRAFLSMEYVDGEDLASLLRRIGRLPPDKALEVAHKICAGLQAAHAKGVLHRDLKPANVMLDGRGNVLIMDFGLAALADQVAPDDVRSGTPAYMAPEQLKGEAVTERSDIYSLGLTLYEVFTGKRAFETRTLAEALRARAESTPRTPSQYVPDLDQAVERAILRCLEPDPALRPASVIAVASALPGGDPLAAALAAGETPSPRVVADAGQTTGFAPRQALLALGGAFLGIALVVVINLRSSRLDRIGLQAPDVLAQKARETLARLGYANAPFDRAAGFQYDRDYRRYIESMPRPEWDAVLSGRPSFLNYWYRTSPEELLVFDFQDTFLTPGIVSEDDPPPTLSGMVNLNLDAQGRLTSLQVIPPEHEADATAPAATDWGPLLSAAELDPSKLAPVAPEWLSLAASDARAAWTGVWPGTSLPMRVEAGSFHGKPVFFKILGSWMKPVRMPAPPTRVETAQKIISALILGLVVFGAAALARRNTLRGNVDRVGGFRLASFVFWLGMGLWVCEGHLVVSLSLLGLFLVATAHALFCAVVIWVLYRSLEPYVRKNWPQTLISWSRILAGRLRDPLVGRDLLSGVLLGLLWALVIAGSRAVRQHAGAAPTFGSSEYLEGARWVAAEFIGHIFNAIQTTLVFFFVLFLLRVLLRRGWLAGVAFVMIFGANSLLSDPMRPLWLDLATVVPVYAIAAIAVLRFGLVGLAAGIFTVDWLLSVPVPSSLDSWYVGPAAVVFLSTLGLAAWGFYNSLGGQRLFKGEEFG
jgi:serine/threonine-protein kinase